jgi:hypothetical protein
MPGAVDYALADGYVDLLLRLAAERNPSVLAQSASAEA